MNDERIDDMTSGEISVDTLLEELRDALNNSFQWELNCRLADDSTWCVWPGQEDDGLKHGSAGRDPFPWENASDARVRLVDAIVRECVRLDKTAMNMGAMQVQGTEGFDFLQARRVQSLLKWQFESQIPQARRERNLWIQWSYQYGVSIMGLGWETRKELGLRRFGIQEAVQVIQQMYGNDLEMLTEAVAFLQAALKHNDADAVQWVKQILAERFPESTAADQSEAVSSLQKHGFAEMPEVRNMGVSPKIRALKPFEDVFFPSDTESCQTARWMATRCFHNKMEVEAKRESGEWDEAFCDKLLEQEGKRSSYTNEHYGIGREVYGTGYGAGTRSVFTSVDDTDGLYEVFYFYHRSVTKAGVPAMYCSVCSPHVRGDREEGLLAKQELYDDGTGMMPFQEKTYWDDRRKLIECVGIPYLIYTYQQEVKALRDYRIDAASISILPPVRRSDRDMNRPLDLSPGQPLHEAVRGSTEFMIPPVDRSGQSEALEVAIRSDAHRLIGCYDNLIPAPVVQLAQQDMVDHALESWRRVLMHIHQLNQIYLPEITVMRVAPSAGGQPFKMSREDIKGQYDISISFDARSVDAEYALRKFELVERIMQTVDANGTIDRNRATELAMRMIDPAWADMLITDGNQGALREMEEEQSALVAMLNGVQPMMKEGVNPQVRQQYLQQQLQQPAIQQMLSQNDVVVKLIQDRFKYLQHQQDQHGVNKAAGTLGVKPNVA